MVLRILRRCTPIQALEGPASAQRGRRTSPSWRYADTGGLRDRSFAAPWGSRPTLNWCSRHICLESKKRLPEYIAQKPAQYLWRPENILLVNEYFRFLGWPWESNLRYGAPVVPTRVRSNTVTTCFPMHLSPGDSVLLAIAGLVAGVMNAVAGGGTFLTFPALVFTGRCRQIRLAQSQSFQVSLPVSGHTERYWRHRLERSSFLA
jgi:hypothetical protein